MISVNYQKRVQTEKCQLFKVGNVFLWRLKTNHFNISKLTLQSSLQGHPLSGRCKLEVAGCRSQVAGCRLQVRISLICGRSWIAFCFVVSHSRDNTKKKPEVEISVHNVFQCILNTNETITQFLLNYIATFELSKSTWFSRKNIP